MQDSFTFLINLLPQQATLFLILVLLVIVSSLVRKLFSLAAGEAAGATK